MRWVALLALLGAGCFSKPPAPAGGDGGVAGDAIDAPVDAYAGPNYMFVTSKTFVGSTINSATAADERCQQAATAVGLPGTYVAWWSTTLGGGVHAVSRIGTARGWIRVDGEPFADSVSDLAAGRMFTPPRINELGQDSWRLSPEEFVYTGTSAAGVAAGSDCASGQTVRIGVMDATATEWTNAGDIACSNNLHLYCFGTSYNKQVVPGPAPTAAKLAFLSGSLMTIDTTMGIAAWDAKCTELGRTVHPDSNFIAFVAGSVSARARLGNGGGRTWYRPDGIKLADEATFDSFDVPLNVTLDKQYIIGTVFGGAPSIIAPASTTDSCTYWTAPTGTGHSPGQVHRGERSAFTGGAFSTCGASHYVYCFEL